MRIFSNFFYYGNLRKVVTESFFTLTINSKSGMNIVLSEMKRAPSGALSN